MGKNNSKVPKAARHEDSYKDNANIKFRSDKREFRIKFIGKIVVFIMISSLSGAVTAYYLTNYSIKKYYSGSANYQTVINNGDGSQGIYDENTITRTAEDIGPAIVAISNKKEDYFENSDTDCSSGVIYDKNGFIVTCYHTIQGAKNIKVKLSSGRIFDAKLIGYDKITDLAVIKINAENLPTGKFGEFSSVKVGQVAMTVGNPFGDEYDASINVGIVSGIKRNLQYGESTYKLIQTDAVINQGNSGGVLCNANEEIIGINDMKIAEVYGNEQGEGFAISADDVKDIAAELIANGKISKPSMGIVGKDIPINDVNIENGQSEAVCIKQVLAGSGAYKAGIKVGDILMQIDDEKIYDINDLSDIINRHSIGDVVSCRIMRNNVVMKVNVKLTERKIIN